MGESNCSRMDVDNDTCHFKHHINPPVNRLISASMFALGIFGNVAALVVLEIRRRRNVRSGGTWQRSLFHIFITSLVVTDLTGTCFTTPLVQLSYSRNLTLVGMRPKTCSLCSYFGASMTFFSLATMLLLLTTALERCFAIGYPYLYSRHVTKKCAYITILLVFLLCIIFCLLPFAGFGKYVQYCPGTWCFIDMNAVKPRNKAYAILYATIMLVLVVAIVVCNAFVVYQLYRMYQRRRRNGSVMSTMRSNSERKLLSMSEEVEHLIMMVVMTVIFIICTLPLVIRVYINYNGENDHASDLNALRFISVNSIVDPWVFILLSPGVQHFCWTSVCRSTLIAQRGSVFKSSLAKENAKLELSRPTLYTEQIDSVKNM
ncbi:prostaglandin E receptor 2a (subtype EP2) isoform X1 [Pelmatolapia mariae]|uniref:prostaglandin E receptor 2a (subtype EP2) isoform X1 n=1 Tax=Pelmatolapia mariae TaxID=158779 RepID=UPI002FE6A1C6